MEKIKELRGLNNMTQEDLALKLGVARTAVSMWETGESKPRLETLIQLSKIFNCSVDELLTKTE